MESEQKYTEESNEKLLFQVEEGLIEDLLESALSTDQAQQVANMLESNASLVKEGKGHLTCGGVAIVEGEEDIFFLVEYVKPKGDIPTYFRYTDAMSDDYLDSILNRTDLVNHEK